MENKTGRELSSLYSGKILFSGKCEICKCFKVLPEEENFMYKKYLCSVKEGDSYCDFIQESLDKIQVIVDSENIEDEEDRREYLTRMLDGIRSKYENTRNS